jgi:hypothetical protein
MTPNKRAWSMAALMAGLLALVALACSDDGTPDVRQSRGIMQPRGDLMTVMVTPMATATRPPMATLWSPMEVVPSTATAEGWSVYSRSGPVTVQPTSSCVTNNCWQWNKQTPSAASAYVYWTLPTPYLIDATPDASLHIAFDIQVLETPSGDANVFMLKPGSTTFWPKLVIRNSGVFEYTPYNGITWQWAISPNTWQHVDIYADQQPQNYRSTKTPQAGEYPHTVSIDGTPIATPTGLAPSLEWDGTNTITRILFGSELQSSSYKFALDNVLVEVCRSASGTCVTPTPQPLYVEVTATNSPTPATTNTFTPTPSNTPTITPTPAPTWTPAPTATPAPTNTPGPTPTPRPTIANQSSDNIHVYDIDTFNAYSGNCTALVAAGATETWSISGSAVYEDVGLNVSSLVVCNVGDIPKQCDLSSTWLTTGYSEAFIGVVGCYPAFNACTAPSNYRELFGGAQTQPCTFGGVPVGGEHSGMYDERWWVYPFGVLSQNYSDRLQIQAFGGGLSFGPICSSAGSAIEIAVDCGPTPTPRPTRTPSPTPSPTVTRTPGPTRATATATLTPTAWSGITCPTAVVTVDANRADWTAIPATPMPLSAANASYIWPAVTPSVADLSGIFWCAHSSDTLYLSGVITDSVLYQDSAPIDDDAAQIAVDGWGDGFLRYRADDHELTITQDGRLRDLATLPITATVATTLTVGGWQFEIGIPKAIIELPTLTQRIIGLVFGLIDDDDGGQLDQQIIAPTRTVLLQ